MDCILDNIIVLISISNVLGMIMVLWVCRKMSLFIVAHAEARKDAVSRQLQFSRGSVKRMKLKES